MPPVWVLLWIVTIGPYIHHTDTFEVTSSGNVLVNSGDNARFYYGVSPWPPPCWHCLPGRPEYEKYKNVEVEFRTTAHGTDELLCDVAYYDGTFDNTTGNCSLYNYRMGDYYELVDAMEFVLMYSQLMDIGTYRLIIKYGNNTHQQPVIVETTNLTVYAAPTHPNVTAWPSTNVDIGINVTFICRVNNGNPPADLKWTRGWLEEVPMTAYKKGTELWDYTVGGFSIKVAKADHGSSYVCHAWNEINEDKPSTSSIALTVNYIPEVRVNPCYHEDIFYHVMEKTNVRFDCLIDAYPEWSEVQWWTNFTGSGENDIPGKEWNDTTHTINQVMRHESGQYGCYANNSKGQSKKSYCFLDVQYKPDVSVTEVIPVKEGERIQSSCSFDANPTVDDYWWHKEKNQTFQLHNVTDLIINSADPKDAGNYTCVASNTPHSGSKVIGEATVEVFVKFSPLWQEYSLTKFTGRDTEYATIICDSWAYPKVTFTWVFNGQTLTPSSGRTITNEDYRSIVNITSVNTDDLGTYTCHAQNSEGTNTFDLYLLSPGKPDRPQKCEVNDQSSDTISVKCVPGYDGGAELSFKVDAQPAKGKAEAKDTVTEWDGDMAVVTVQGLHPSTQYLLYVYGYNMYGRSDSAYNVDANTTVGPEPSPSAPGDGLNIGAIVGGTIGVILAVALLVGLAAYGYWRYQPKEKEDENEDDESAAINGVSHVGKRHKRSPKDEYDMGIYNEGFDDMSLERQRSVPNDYIDHPGMVKVQQGMSGAGALEPVGWKTQHDQHHVRSPDDVRIKDYSAVRQNVKSVGNTSPLSPTTERVYYTARKNAYEQRQRQSNLAGMGALSHSSHQILATSHDPVAPPRKRRSRVSFDDEFWEFDRECLRLDKRLGEGAFGEVWRGIANGIREQTGQKFVAVKMLRDGSTVDEQRALLKELEVMKLIKPHRNVIGLQGCCSATDEEPMFIIMDYASKGNLQQFLRDNRQPSASARRLTTTDLTRFALQIAYGMDHISSKELLHRDLAGRNVLLDHDYNCKISDFGFARDVIDCRHYESKTQRRLPLRWMAPESLIDSVYTTKSDVWSFGIVLWEIVTLGSSPYPGVGGPEVMEMIKKGYRMEKPRHCPSPLYGLMMECWHVDPTYRPTFSALCKKLEAILDYMTEDPDASIPVFRMRDNMFDIHQNLPGEKC